MAPQATAADKQAQISALDQLKKEGLLTGVTSAWHLLKSKMPINNPSKKTIATYMRDKPDLQPHRMPRNVTGPKHSIAAVIPDAKPLSAVFVDTFFLAPSLKKKVAFTACILYIDALTKAIHLQPCALGQADRPFSSTNLAGLKTFINKVQTKAGDSNLMLLKVRTDGGGENLGDFKQWLADQREAHPHHFKHTMTSGSRASGNSLAERCISSVRRIIGAHFRSKQAQWIANDIPNRDRRYNWTDYAKHYEDTYMNRVHNTIKCTPNDAVRQIGVTYTELRDRIIERAEKRYGNRVLDPYQPTKMRKENQVLKVGDHVRKQTYQSNKPGRNTLDASKSNKASFGENYSSDLFIIDTVNAAENTRGGGKQTTYLLRKHGSQAQERGVWTRAQLLFVPASTLDYTQGAEAEEQDDDDSDDDYNDKATGSIRPPRDDGHRYKQNDILLIDRKFWDSSFDNGAISARKLRQLRRESHEANITRRLPRRANRPGVQFYTIEIDGETFRSIPNLDTSAHVEFLAEP